MWLLKVFVVWIDQICEFYYYQQELFPTSLSMLCSVEGFVSEHAPIAGIPVEISEKQKVIDPVKHIQPISPLIHGLILAGCPHSS